MSIRLSAAASLILAAGLLAQPVEGRRVALLIGVNEYENRKLDDLRYAERDVTELAKELKAAGYEIRLMLGSSAGDDKATKANIDKALDDVLKKITKKDTLIVALAGHGQQVPVMGKDEAFFCPHDAILGRPSTLISMSGIMKDLDDRGGRANLMLIDACRNDPDPNRGRGIDGSRVSELPEGTAIMFSCSRGQKAYESPEAGGGHGVFFHFVLEGIRGKAANAEGEVTWGRLATFVSESVERDFGMLVKSATTKQMPHEIKNLAFTPIMASNRRVASGTPKPPVDPPIPMPPDDSVEKRRPRSAEYPLDADAAKQLQREWAEYVGRKVEVEYELGGARLTTVLLPPGTFRMGESQDDSTADTDEKPAHAVTLTRPFAVGRTEVTVGQFKRFVAETSYQTDAEKANAGTTWKNAFAGQTDDHPVSLTTYNDGVAFCEWLTKKTGKKFRLPTEAEWEYACRGGSAFCYSHGKDEARLGEYAVAVDVPQPQPVASRKPNAWGLYDLHGNVWEWCGDGKRTYTAERQTDPFCEAKERVYRGGNYNCSARLNRATHRSAPFGNDYRESWVGMRVAAEEAAPRGDGPGRVAKGRTPAVYPVSAEECARLQREWADHLGRRVEVEYDLGGAKLSAVLLPPGTFAMGESPGDSIADTDEKPAHQVTLTRPFAVGKTEVTIAQFRKFVEDAGYKTDAEKAGAATTWRNAHGGQRDDHPACQLSYNDGVAFCEWATRKTGKKFRLPTEAEWEYACRGGATTRYSFGTDEARLSDYAVAVNNPSPAPVGSKKPNAWGLYDMQGNVWEWCGDGKREYAAEKQTDPFSTEPKRVYRGGNYGCEARLNRATHRSAPFDPNYSEAWIGFRVAVEP